MKFSLCFCLKRNRAIYDIPSTNIYCKNCNSTTSTVTLAPLPLLSNIPVVSIESDYERIIDDSSGDREIDISNNHETSITSIEYRNCSKLISNQPLQQSLDDYSELYATVDKTRKTNNRTEIKTNTANTNGFVHQQGSSLTSRTDSSSQSIFSPNSHLSRYTTTVEHPPPLPRPSLPLPTVPLQVPLNITMNAITNDHEDTSRHHRPYYDEIIIRESLEHRMQRLHMEDDQPRQDQQLDENYYSSINSEQGTTTSSDLYAEIGNDSASGTVYQNFQSYQHSQPSNTNEKDDDLSEHYATIIEINNNGEQSTTNRIYQEMDSFIV